MIEKPNPAELLKEWMKEYEVRIRELQSVSAYLGARVERLEKSASLSAPSPAAAAQSPAPFLGVEEVAKLLSSTPYAIRAKLRRREFPTGVLVRIGRRGIRFDREKLLAWIRSKEIKNPMDGLLDR